MMKSVVLWKRTSLFLQGHESWKLNECGAKDNQIFPYNQFFVHKLSIYNSSDLFRLQKLVVWYLEIIIPSRERSHIPPWEVRKNIDSKVPFLGGYPGYVSSQEGSLIHLMPGSLSADKSSQDANDWSWSSTPGIHRTINSDCCKSLDLAAIRHSSHRKLEVVKEWSFLFPKIAGEAVRYEEASGIYLKRSMAALQMNLEETLEQRLTEKMAELSTQWLTGIEWGGSGKLNPWLFWGVGNPSLVALPPKKRNHQPFYRFFGQLEATRENQKLRNANKNQMTRQK